MHRLYQATRVSFRISLLEQWRHINLNPHSQVAMVTWCTCFEVSFVSPLSFFSFFLIIRIFTLPAVPQMWFTWLPILLSPYLPDKFLHLLLENDFYLTIIAEYTCSHRHAYVPVSQCPRNTCMCACTCTHVRAHTRARTHTHTQSQIIMLEKG